MDNPNMDNRNLLLVSNSKTQTDPRFLGYCEREVQEHFKGVQTVLFIPYAEPSAVNSIALNARRARNEPLDIPYSKERRDVYTDYLRGRFQQMGFNLVGIHEQDNPIQAIKKAQAVYIGGGNTFDLLRTLNANGLFEPIQKRVKEGMPYLGVSAGTVVAGMNIGSSNDNSKPVPSLDALELVPFCIKPHYQEPFTISNEDLARIRDINVEAATRLSHQGETHLDRTMEFHHDFPYTVVGLKEGGILHVKGNTVTLIGNSGARILPRSTFITKYEPAQIYEPGSSIDFILQNPPAKVLSEAIINQAGHATDSWFAHLSDFEKTMFLLRY